MNRNDRARENYLRKQQEHINRVMGNKQRRDEGIRKDKDKTEVVLKDALKWANDRSYNNMEKANKEVQKVLDYYRS